MSTLIAEVARLIESALETYKRTHIVPREFVAEVRRDFARFNRETIKRGLRGIRWNFNGCIGCPEFKQQQRLRRILLVDPFVVAATQGRAFGTVVCAEHEGATDSIEGLATVIIPGALRRIAEEPPLPKAAA